MKSENTNNIKEIQQDITNWCDHMGIMGESAYADEMETDDLIEILSFQKTPNESEQKN